MSRIWINDVELSPMGRSLTIEDIEISREDRTASGRLVSDVIAVKKKFTINYSFITNEILEQLSNLYNASGTKILKIEQENGSTQEYRVRFRPFSRSRYLIGKKWFWEGISLELEEI